MPRLNAVKAVPPIVYYTVLRLVLFVLPLVALLLLRVEWWIAVVAAALIGLCLSYIMLAGPRHAVATDIYERRHRDKPLPNEDDDAEDAFVDGMSADRDTTGETDATDATVRQARWKPSDAD